MPIRKAIIKSGACVFTGAQVLVLEYGKVAQADLFLVEGSIVARFYGSIHDGAWQDQQVYSHKLVLGLGGFLMEDQDGKDSRHVAVVPMSQLEGVLRLSNGVTTTLKLRGAQLDTCPSCGQGDVTGGSVVIERNVAAQTCLCSHCSTSWVDTYQHVKREVEQ